jgi:hypothetical protein
LGKPNLLIDPEFGFAPFGAQLEGLIHAARCPTDKLTALLAPAVGGLDWPGGLSSSFMNTSAFFERVENSAIPALPAPGANQTTSAGQYLCQDLFLNFYNLLPRPFAITVCLRRGSNFPLLAKRFPLS